MFCMRNPVNIVLPTDVPYCTQRKMDFGKSSFTNISVKQQKEEYSLKKEAYGGTSSGEDEEQSEKSSDDEKKPSAKQTSSDDKKLSLIKSEDIRPYDILCGRDKATFNNVGNRRFRVLVRLNIPRYEAARTKAQKAQVIKYICDVFTNEVGVRFLKKDKSGEGYIELNGSEARKKVGHALRDMSVAEQQLNEKRRSIKSVDQQREIDRRRSMRGNDADFDGDLLEPLPIDEQLAYVPQQLQIPQRNDQHLSHPSNTPTHSPEHQYKADMIPDLAHRIMQNRPQQQQEQPISDLQQTLLRLQQQQQKLQQERQELLQQQQYQQQLLEQQLLNRRRRQQQQQQQLLEQQQQQQQQQRQQQQHDGLNDFGHFFETMSRQQKRPRR